MALIIRITAFSRRSRLGFLYREPPPQQQQRGIPFEADSSAGRCIGMGRDDLSYTVICLALQAARTTIHAHCTVLYYCI